MGWILTILIGLAAGWIAEQVTKTDMSTWMNLAVGLVGALVGKLIFGILPFVPASGGLIWSLVVASVGAIVLVFAVNAIRAKATT